MFENVEAVRKWMERHRPQNFAEGYPLKMRQEVGAWLRAQHAEGARWTDLGTALAISSTTAHNWAKLASSPENPPSTPAFIPLRLPPPHPALSPSTAPVLTSPNGYRVEGLDTNQLLALLRGLG